jgi:peptidoglycan hydrolase CwlO-like protein
MQLTLTSAEQQLKSLNEQIKRDQAQWNKKQERVRELKDQIRMTKGLYQQALERVLRVHPKWEDVLHAYVNNSGRWSMWVTRWPQLGEWVRTVQKYEDRLFRLEGEVVPLAAAQNVLAKRINDMKETRKDAQREVNRLSNILEKLREKMKSACRRSR